MPIGNNSLTINRSEATGNGDLSEECHKIVDDHSAFILQMAFYVCLCGSVSVMGIGANIVNIIVFIRIGILSDSSTVSLFGLAVSDLLCMIFLLWLSICFGFALGNTPGLPFDVWSVLFVTAGTPHVLFTHVTCWTTAFIAFERSVSVVFPFKVKALFSAKRSMVAIILIFVCVFGANSALFIGKGIRYVYNPITNASILVIIQEFSLERKADTFLNYFNAVAMRFTAILSVMILNVVITWKVNTSKKWRQAAASGKGKDNSTKQSNDDGVTSSNEKDKISFQKERKLVRMITTICTIFSICYAPHVIFSIVHIVRTDIYNGGTQHNLFHLLYSIGFLLDAINSSVNIFVYYYMSSRYKLAFRQWLGLKEN